MLLIGVKADGGWLSSRWNLTYRVGWEHICKGVHSVYDFYDGTEVLIGGGKAQIDEKDDILKLEEGMNLTVRGMSKILGVPVMITFYNQTQAVDVNVPQMGEEFKEADYEKFNKSLCQYMDSIELAMYR